MRKGKREIVIKRMDKGGAKAERGTPAPRGVPRDAKQAC